MIYLQLCFSFSPGALKMDEVLAGYELCSVAPSLFDDNGFMRSGGKSKLADYLVPAAAKTQGSINDILKNKQNKIVLDGGALVQRVTWPRGSTFQQVLESYELHIRKMCGSLVNRVQVVFDGYTENSTKDHIHLKRNPVQSMEMHFKVDQILPCKKSIFLSNPLNKHRFIGILKNHLQSQGIVVFQSQKDADLMIVQKAVQLIDPGNSMVMFGDDTDLLVLATHMIRLVLHKAISC